MLTDKELSTITGLSSTLVKGYKRIYPLLLVHQVAEDALNKTDGSLKKAVIDIPNVGTLVYNRKSKTYKFKPYFMFDWQVRQALEGKSSLVEQAEKNLIRSIEKNYDELI